MAACCCVPDCDSTVAALQDQGKTVTALADDTRILALFVVADTVRDTSQQVGIDAVHADLLPHEKLTLIEQLISQGTTGIVGDGINDAPALARSDIGFAMGIKAVFLIMAIVGVATMWMTVFADVGASLIALMNSLRLLRHQ